MKDNKDRAPFLDMEPGLFGIRYKQEFVRAPMSLHPPKTKPRVDKFDPLSVMKITLGE